MIKALNIEKSYNGEKVLKSVSIEASHGDFTSIMGESGSGKSTFLSILGGFLDADGGDVFWNGVNIKDYDENQIAAIRCKDVGFVFQSFKLIPTLNIRDNILLPLTLGGSLDGEALKYVDWLTDSLEIGHLLKKFPAQLSGGQCQRVAIARALAYKPSAVILDEPTGALDSVMEEKVMNLLSKINREQNTTIIQVTHSKRVAEYADKIILLKDGEILS